MMIVPNSFLFKRKHKIWWIPQLSWC